MAKLEKKEILSSSLTKLNGTTKDLINFGIYFLYEIDSALFSNVKYLLSTDKQKYLLVENGDIISVESSDDTIKYKSIISFNDIPKPPKLNAINLAVPLRMVLHGTSDFTTPNGFIRASIIVSQMICMNLFRSLT